MIVDVNTTLGLWPFRRVPGDTLTDFVARLKRHNVAQAWAGTFDGVFHRDLTSSNARLANACRTIAAGLLLPFGSVNPSAPGWREDLRRCHEVHRMPGIRLHPNYHGYTLSDAAFSDVLRAAVERRMLVQLVLSLEDERTQHPLMRVPPVNPTPLARIVSQTPGLRLIILNRNRLPTADGLAELVKSGEVYFDIAAMEGTGCAGELLSVVSPQRVLFGSHAPFQYFESALLKLKESAITGAEETAILRGNARRLLQSAPDGG